MPTTDRPTRIWITRTQPGADATAVWVRLCGIEAVVAPVLEVRPIEGVEIDLADAEAVAFTSGHGVRAFAALNARRDLAAFCVGEATADIAKDLGFTDARPADGDVHVLADLIAATAPRPRLVVVPGADEPAADLPALLAERGVGARAVGVYRTIGADLAGAPEDIDAVLIHSAKAARLVGELVGAAVRSTTVFAISQAAAQPLRDQPFRRIVVAETPTEAALLDLIGGEGGDAGPTRRVLGRAFWALIVLGFLCALAGLAIGRYGPVWFPVK